MVIFSDTVLLKNRARSYSDSSMYRSRAERVSEEAVWQAIERVADEMKRSAHSHGDTVCSDILW